VTRQAAPARILVVDDEPLNIDYLQQELEVHGFEIDTAANGVEALERVAAAPPDLVLLDVMMPELDGIAALRILKGDPETRLIPVVLMTALNAVEDRVRGIEAGADDFLSKPVDDRELLARIRTALSVKRTIDATVDELRSTSAHLERYGRQERDVAVMVVEWRLRDPSLPTEAIAFVGRRHRAAAEELIVSHGGTVSESDAPLLVGVFDAVDTHAGSCAAVEAARATLADCVDEAIGLVAAAAVDVGRATVGSTRIEEAGAGSWVWGALGVAVERASDLARHAAPGELAVSFEAAAALGDGYKLIPSGPEAQRVIQPSADVAIAKLTDYPGGLSHREVEVLRLVAVGLSDAEVAGQLFLSVRTVHAHLRSIYRKLGLRSRTAAARFAEENRLL
jgi:DNA-binding NarL/FixJ family response regulator